MTTTLGRKLLLSLKRRSSLQPSLSLCLPFFLSFALFLFPSSPSTHVDAAQRAAAKRQPQGGSPPATGPAAASTTMTTHGIRSATASKTVQGCALSSLSVLARRGSILALLSSLQAQVDKANVCACAREKKIGAPRARKRAPRRRQIFFCTLVGKEKNEVEARKLDTSTNLDLDLVSLLLKFKLSFSLRAWDLSHRT